MDTTKFAESDFIDVKLIAASKSKKAVILDEGKEETVTFQGRSAQKMTYSVEIDGKRKGYRPNRASMENIIQAAGAESKAHVGKVLNFVIVPVNGKDSVIATVQR